MILGRGLQAPGNLFFLGVFMAYIVQSFSELPNSFSYFYKDNVGFEINLWLAQSFTTGASSYTISGVWLRLFQNKRLPAKEITVSIRATSENEPIGTDLAIGTLDISNAFLGWWGEWKQINFDSTYELSGGTTYAIVVRVAGEDYSMAGLASCSDPSYADGVRSFSTTEGNGWGVFSENRDFIFAILATGGDDVIKLSPRRNSVVSTGAITILDWEDPGSGATKYSWTLTYEHPIFGTSIISATVNAPTTEKDVSSSISSIYDTGARECTWALRPYIDGEYVADDDPWTLEIIGPPATAINPTPADTATSIAMAPLLQWGLDGPLGDDDYFFIYLNTDIDKMSTAAGLQQGWIVTPRLQVLSGLIANTTYYWQVHVANTQGWSESAIWSFTTRDFASPTYSTRERLVYGEPGGPGDPEGDPSGERNYETVPSGENNMLTVRRLIVAARNRIYYEDF